MSAATANGRGDVEGASVPLLLDGENRAPHSLYDIVKTFGWMGWAAFGGPAAHVGLFQKVPAWAAHLSLRPSRYCSG